MPRTSVTLALAVLLVAGVADAEDPDAIMVDVQIIHGSNKDGKSDPRCDHVKKILPISLKHFQQVKRTQLKLELGQAQGMELPSGRIMRLIPISVIGDRLHLHVKMDGLVDTGLQLASGRPVIVGGESHQDGKTIVKLTPSFPRREPQPVVKVPAVSIPRQALQPTPNAPDLQRVGHQ